MMALFSQPSGSCIRVTALLCRIFFWGVLVLPCLALAQPGRNKRPLPDARAIFLQFVQTYRYSPSVTHLPGSIWPETVKLREGKRRGNSAIALSAGLVQRYREAGVQAWVVEGLSMGPEKGLLIGDTTFADHAWVVVFDSARWIIADPARGAGEVALRTRPVRLLLFRTFGLPFSFSILSVSVIDPTAWNILPDSQLIQHLPLWGAWQLRTPELPTPFLPNGPAAQFCAENPSEAVSYLLSTLRFSELPSQMVQEAEALLTEHTPGKTRALAMLTQAGYALSASPNTDDRRQAKVALSRAGDAGKAAGQEPRHFFQLATQSLALRRDTLSHALSQVRQLNNREMVFIRAERGRLKGDSEVQSEKIRALSKAENAANKDNALARVRRSRNTQDVRVGDLKTQLRENQQYIGEIQGINVALIGEMPPLYAVQKHLYQARLANMAELLAALRHVKQADLIDLPTLHLLPACDTLNVIRSMGSRLADSIQVANDSLVAIFSLRNRLLYRAVLRTRESKNLIRSLKAASHASVGEEKAYQEAREQLHTLYQAMRDLRREKQIYNKRLLQWLTEQQRLARATSRECHKTKAVFDWKHAQRSKAISDFANDWNRHIKDIQAAGRRRMAALKRVMR